MDIEVKRIASNINCATTDSDNQINILELTKFQSEPPIVYSKMSYLG